MKFKNGDRVRIRADSTFLPLERGTEGIIIDDKCQWSIKVLLINPVQYKIIYIQDIYLESANLVGQQLLFPFMEDG